MAPRAGATRQGRESDREVDACPGPRHLLWVPGAAALGFLASFVFADVLQLPSLVYHFVYFALVGGFFTLYAVRSALRLRTVLGRRLVPALVLGALAGLALTWRVFADPPSAGSSGFLFAWDLVWRGLLYGSVDGALLSAFPWLVAWRALGGESASLPKRVGLTLLAFGFGLFTTTAYHLGYRDFRGPKVAQATLGNAIASLPTLLSMNPLASPLAHAILHIAAVAHNPQSDLFLPPHDLSSTGHGRDTDRSPRTPEPVVDFPLRGAWQAFQHPGHAREAFDFVALGGAAHRYVSLRVRFTRFPLSRRRR